MSDVEVVVMRRPEYLVVEKFGEAGEVAAAVAAIRAGRSVLLPADGVYGLCASAFREAPVRRPPLRNVSTFATPMLTPEPSSSKHLERKKLRE